ncbi:hypothetical protein HPB50_010517 [Hyalomma asiaticum]|uniref:Uncharacterized protein n=1 Tax=Hyalomma asiaticum TaxID=266040 RepID=A0ACB7STM5_HYAAI|nr:hypothetical protein HPB50_010517 [Hyalomma asiaticum]
MGVSSGKCAVIAPREVDDGVCLLYPPRPRWLSLLTAVPGPTPLLAPSFCQVLQEQESQAIPSPHAAPPVPVPLSYAEVAAQPPQPTSSPPLFVVPSRPIHPSRITTSMPTTGSWRTPDNLPVCYLPGIPGHVARLCRRRLWLHGNHQPVWPYSAPSSPFSPPNDSRLPSTYNVTPAARDRRSPSKRRRSLSPMRRFVVPLCFL